jgi:hypothetical protein
MRRLRLSDSVRLNGHLEMPMRLGLLRDVLERPWTDLRAISNSYAARATILIPLIGYLVLFNDNVIHYLEIARELDPAANPGRISARLLWVYFGLCTVSVGALLYAIWCPYEVKTHGDAMSFIKDAQTTVTNDTAP